jgi:hypothetical protein
MSLKPAPDDGFPLTRERADMRQKVASLQRILDYQGDPAVALTIKDEQIRAQAHYIKALERAVRRLAER